MALVNFVMMLQKTRQSNNIIAEQKNYLADSFADAFVARNSLPMICL